MSEPRYYLPQEVVRHAVALKTVLRLSYRGTQELMRARKFAVSHEVIRSWVSDSAAPRRLPLLPLGSLWQPQVRTVTLRGEVRYLWLAVAEDGAVGELLLQSRRNDSLATLRLKRGLAEQRRLWARAGGGHHAGE
jgi:putative transposase